MYASDKTAWNDIDESVNTASNLIRNEVDYFWFFMSSCLQNFKYSFWAGPFERRQFVPLESSSLKDDDIVDVAQILLYEACLHFEVSY